MLTYGSHSPLRKTVNAALLGLTFLGAAGTVTGSCFLLEHDTSRVLVDAGVDGIAVADQAVDFREISAVAVDRRDQIAHHIARLRHRVAADLGRVRKPDHRKAVNRLRRIDRMPASNRNARSRTGRSPPFEDLAHHFRRQFVERHTENGKRENRLAAHRVDVGNRIRGGDFPEIMRIIHHRHEEVGRRNDARLVIDLPDSSIIRSLGTDQQRGIRMRLRHPRKERLKHGRRQLTAAPAPMRERCQTNRGR